MPCRFESDYEHQLNALVVESEDTYVWGAYDESRAGSSPAGCTSKPSKVCRLAQGRALRWRRGWVRLLADRNVWLVFHGDLPKRLKGLVSKTSRSETAPGFESQNLRQLNISMHDWWNRQTRAFQGRVRQLMWVQVPHRAPGKMREWRNGRRSGLKIHRPNKSCGFKSRFTHHKHLSFL